MIRIPLSFIADLLLWGTMPLWGLLAFWEHHLSLPDNYHKLIQAILVLFVLGWAYVWNRIGERDRLAHYKSQNAPRSIYLPSPCEMTRNHEPDEFSEPDPAYWITRKDISMKIMERQHVSKN